MARLAFPADDDGVKNHAPVPRPVVGIVCGADEREVRTRRAYVNAIAAAGGLPVLLAPIDGEDVVVLDAARQAVRLCDAVVLTGGDDPRTEAYGEPTHPAAKLVHPDRQRFDEAVLRAIDELATSEERQMPTLGVCLGMQMMALVAGGTLNQHLPEDIQTAANHLDDRLHAVRATSPSKALGSAAGEVLGEVASWHHQAVRTPGRLRVIAAAEDGVIEAIDDPERRWYVGVQWHPERTADAKMGLNIFRALVNAASDGGR